MKAKKDNTKKIVFGLLVFAGAFFLIRQALKNFDFSKKTPTPAAPSIAPTTPAATTPKPQITPKPLITISQPINTIPNGKGIVFDENVNLYFDNGQLGGTMTAGQRVVVISKRTGGYAIVQDGRKDNYLVNGSALAHLQT